MALMVVMVSNFLTSLNLLRGLYAHNLLTNSAGKSSLRFRKKNWFKNTYKYFKMRPHMSIRASVHLSFYLSFLDTRKGNQYFFS